MALSSKTLTVKQYHNITLVACFFITAIIFTGAAVRVTGSGLGCSTWPKCTPESFTPTDSSSIHPFIEFGNRLFTGALSISVIVAIAGSFFRRPYSKALVWMSLTLVGGVVAQIVIGGVTVLLDLNPLAVGSHMLASMILLSCAVALAVMSKYETPPSLKSLFSRSTNSLIAILSYIIVVLGIVVTAAGPHAGDQSVPRLNVSIESVARIHSLSAWTLLVVVSYLLFIKKNQNKYLKSLFAVLLIQGAWGYTQYFLGVPAWMASVHVLFAAILFIVANLYWTELISTEKDMSRDNLVNA